jgi:orotate phosphoribosyltransferase
VARPIDLLAPNRVRLSAAQARDELRQDIVRAALVEGSFVLASGTTQPYYFDKYLFATRPAILRRLARFLAELVPAGTERLAAPTLGAVPLGTAVSLELGLPLVVVHAEWERGRSRAFEGELYADESVTVIEDVVASGIRALRTVARVREAGASVRRLVAVVDRGEGGAERLAEEAIDYAHLFTARDLGIVPGRTRS